VILQKKACPAFMCRKAEETTLKMVTPTKVKHHNHHNQRGSHRGGGKGWTPPPNKQRGTTSSPVGNAKQAHTPKPTSTKGYQSPQQHRNKPASPSLRSSPCFAMSKCYEPPTPDSLPKPPTSWHTAPAAQLPPSRKQLFTDDIDDSAPELRAANQHLKMLLNVQA